MRSSDEGTCCPVHSNLLIQHAYARLIVALFYKEVLSNMLFLKLTPGLEEGGGKAAQQAAGCPRMRPASALQGPL